MKRLLPILSCLLLLVIVTGCRGAHTAWEGDGPQSDRIAHLLRLFVIICSSVWGLVVLFMLVAVLRRRHGMAVSEGEADTEPDPATEKRVGIAVSSCVGLTIIILFVFLFADFVTGRAIHEFSLSGDPVTLTVVGHQWWWEVHYEDANPSKIIVTANEIHIPTGRPIKIEVNSADVIHSFWVPNLHGKKDLIPGHPVALWLQADKPGTYYGQCAEFCGYEHAKMRIVVIAEDPMKFDHWLDAARQPAATPTTDAQKRGQQVFLSSTCSMCHTILGTQAHGVVGPDLTHLASRGTLAAGSLPNTTGHLAGWIADPQTIKPGVQMPQNVLEPKKFRDLLDYLNSLQ